VVITFSLSAPQPTPTVVHYSIGGSAALGQDYTLTDTPGQVVIPAGELSARVGMDVLNDGLVEKQETAIFTVVGKTKGHKSVKIFIVKPKTKGRGHR
jgi:hypothetical protein